MTRSPMPDRSLFFDQPVGSIVQECPRQVGPPGGKWDVNCILNILCKNDPGVVADLAATDVTAVDSLTWDDLHFNGKKWLNEHFDGRKWVPGGPVGLGGWDPDAGELVVLSKQSCEDATTTIYHELIHKHQPRGMDWSAAEREAYTKTEQWTIDRGLKGQGHGALRVKVWKRDGKGKLVKDKKGKLVLDHYEVKPAAIDAQVKTYPTKPGPRPVEADEKGNRTKWWDPAKKTYFWQPSRFCESVPGPERRTGEDYKKKSDWKCPP